MGLGVCVWRGRLRLANGSENSPTHSFTNVYSQMGAFDFAYLKVHVRRTNSWVLPCDRAAVLNLRGGPMAE